MKLKIIKRNVAPAVEAAPLVESALPAEKVRATIPTAEQPSPPKPVTPNPPMPSTLGSKPWFPAYLEANPHKKAQYEEAMKLPHGQRATICGSCGHAYVLPCITEGDRANCMNWKFLQQRKEA